MDLLFEGASAYATELTPNKFNDNAVEVMATIVNVEKSETTNIEVQYNVNGEQLTSKINNYSSNTKPKKNDIIKIYYNSNNPKEIKVNKDSNIFIFTSYTKRIT